MYRHVAVKFELELVNLSKKLRVHLELCCNTKALVYLWFGEFEVYCVSFKV